MWPRLNKMNLMRKRPSIMVCIISSFFYSSLSLSIQDQEAKAGIQYSISGHGVNIVVELNSIAL